MEAVDLDKPGEILNSDYAELAVDSRRAEAFGAAEGWPVTTHDTTPPPNAESLLEWLPHDVREAVEKRLRAGNRVPEEVLGPHELSAAWNA